MARAAAEPCWNCIKGRHAICSGEPDDLGFRCECPVCHANRYVDRQPVYDGPNNRYYDPGPEEHDPDSPLPLPVMERVVHQLVLARAERDPRWAAANPEVVADARRTD